MKELLDAILELIRLLLAQILDPRAIMAKRRIAHGGFERGIVQPIELEREEQEMD